MPGLAPPEWPAPFGAVGAAITLGMLSMALFVLGVVTARGRSLLGGAIAFAVGDVLGVRRGHVVCAMRRAGVHRPEATATRMYRVLAVHLLEVLASSLRSRILQRVVLPPELDALGRTNAGAVVVTAHTGNWDLVACAVARRSPLTVVTKHLSVGWLDRLWQGLRVRRGVQLVSVGEAAQRAMAALGRGELVAMMADQVPMRRRGVIEADFLGEPASVDLAPALLAMRARVPLVIAFPWRDGSGLHRCHVVGVLTPPARGSRRWAEAAMQEVTSRLARFVRERPEQWLWMHRRWLSFEARRVRDAGQAHRGPETAERLARVGAGPSPRGREMASGGRPSHGVVSEGS